MKLYRKPVRAFRIWPDKTNGMYGLYTWHVEAWKLHLVVVARWG